MMIFCKIMKNISNYLIFKIYIFEYSYSTVVRRSFIINNIDSNSSSRNNNKKRRIKKFSHTPQLRCERIKNLHNFQYQFPNTPANKLYIFDVRKFIAWYFYSRFLPNTQKTRRNRHLLTYSMNARDNHTRRVNRRKNLYEKR